MTMDDLDVLAQYYISEYWEKREDGRERGFAVYHQERDMVDFQAICKVSNTRPAGICMCDDNNFVPPVNQFLAFMLAYSRAQRSS